ncbi:hypothetical protein BDA96_K002000 [Sorghum bicolor]|uniref:Uncharacterized protein n=1 Tax=Sorghum bicolor TaxID=4558 RepID=A0A921PXI5_SORBI|nr:hypothetical protein BDA96_K002000 [Sorghum bicolor]
MVSPPSRGLASAPRTPRLPPKQAVPPAPAARLASLPSFVRGAVASRASPTQIVGPRHDSSSDEESARAGTRATRGRRALDGWH